MYIFAFASKLLLLLVPVAIVSTVYLYLYPAFHACVFPVQDGSIARAFSATVQSHWSSMTGRAAHDDISTAPFKLLVLADPQLEGDSSLPKPEDAFLPKLARHWTRLRAGEREGEEEHPPSLSDVAGEIVSNDIPEALQALRKRLDLFGNDYYLGHIYRSLHWWTRPTHVTVLGDLLGSQWVADDEFEWRAWRYWNRVVANGDRVDDDIMHLEEEGQEHVLEMDDPTWANKIINIAGNHDIGYAGDITQERMERFERAFGKANWDVRFRYPEVNATSASDRPSLHLVVLNSLMLDTPVLSEHIQAETYDYLNSVISNRLRPVEDRTSFLLLLTHLPLYKRKGICVDPPQFNYWPNDSGGGAYKARGLKEQNHLSKSASQPGMMEALFGMSGNLRAPAAGKGRNGLILTGHDHEGCDVWHYVPVNSTWVPGVDNVSDNKKTEWQMAPWNEANMSDAHTGVHEVTLRSMMGDFGGNAALLSAWFDFEGGEWQYDIRMCGLNLKLWWAVHVVDLVVLALVAVLVVNLAATRAVTPAKVNGPAKSSKSSKRKEAQKSPARVLSEKSDSR